ncbi:putative RNA-directed DNA polymerase [Lupinus albus]|uniref:Putative RNA-directed DNA polymerase n=1 Tax=Lupinus albus TaxID=3870 RepID=A0A6A4NCI4_LUPAL|nr:putative RNA-directed DNA polymerase [Lupinus albus]
MEKQQVVAKLSTETEYRAMSLAASEAQWLLYLLHDLEIPHSQPVVMFCDNQSALHIAANSVFHERTKHIEVDCHFVREKVESGILHLIYIPTTSQIADLFTKSLSPNPFQNLVGKLGMLDIHIPACGRLLKSNDIKENEEE